MDPYTASKFDLQERLHTDDRAEAARYDWYKQHECTRDRIAIKKTIAESRFGDHAKLVPLTRKIPCCLECWMSYWQHEEPESELHNPPVVKLHPNQAA